MSRATGFWNKRGFITKKGEAFVSERLKSIRKELRLLDSNDFATFELEDAVKDIRENYIGHNRKKTAW